MMKRILTLAVAASVALMSFNAPAHAGGHGGGDKEEPGIKYMELDPLLLPVIDDTGITQQVSLIVKLEVADAEKAGKIEKMMPKIVDAFVADLYGTFSNKNSMLSNGVLRLDRIKSRLKTTADKVAGDDMISDVLLQVVQQHRV